MKIKIDSDLKKLSGIYSLSGCKLYVVGGYVRNALMGFYNTDCDIAGSLTMCELQPLLENTPYKPIFQDKKTGTVLIKCGNKSYEYTPFRGEEYETGGKHRPENVKFHVTLQDDAVRRDFTANAVYYDIEENRITDPLNGVSDINNRVLKAVTSPEKVMSADGLRILRLVRIAAELGFDIDNNLYTETVKRKYLLKDISAERIKKEFDKILTADTKYPGMSLNGHVKGINMLIDMGIMEMLFPELLDLKGLAQPAKYHVYDALDHTLEVFKNSSPDIRLAALLHDVGKAESVKRCGNMHKHAETGAEIAAVRLRQLKYSNKEINETVRLIENHMYDIDGKTKESKLRLFIVKNYDIINKQIELKCADASGKGKPVSGENISEKWRNLLERMKKDGTPFSMKDLKVNGRDIIFLRPDIEAKDIKTVLQTLFRETVIKPCANCREILLKRIASFKIKKG